MNFPPITKDPFFAAYVTLVALFACVSFSAFPHVIDGDAVGYESAVRVFAGGEKPHIEPGIPEHTLDVVTVHRLLMTPLSVASLYVFSEVFGFIPGWLMWDVVFFFGCGVLMYALLIRIFASPPTALIGGLFFMGNYAMVTSGLGMFVDISAWFFYLLALYVLHFYLEQGKYRYLLTTALIISIGGLFKENAYTPLAALGILMLYREWRQPVLLIARAIPLGVIALLPAFVHHLSIYREYGYTYLYWMHLAKDFYHYSSRFAEYIKNLGSLLTLLAPLSLFGGILYLREKWSPFLAVDQRIFIAAVTVSGFPALLWPALEQRVMFLVVPALVLFAGIALKKYERFWPYALLILTPYVLIGFLMDAYVLDFVNLPL